MSSRPPGVEILLEGKATGGAFCLLRLVLERGDGSGWHVHTREDETLAVAAGTLFVEDDEGDSVIEPGDAHFLAQGTRHRFRAGDDGAELFVIAAPAGLEDFFRALEAGEESETAAVKAGLQLG